MRVGAIERTEGNSPVGIAYNAFGIGPHALTQRASYTVPTGKKVRIDSASLSVGQMSMPTAGGLIRVYITDESRDIIGLAWTDLTSTDQPPSVAIGFAGYYGPGGTLSIYTADASAGSNVAYRINLRMMLMS